MDTLTRRLTNPNDPKVPPTDQQRRLLVKFVESHSLKPSRGIACLARLRSPSHKCRWDRCPFQPRVLDHAEVWRMPGRGYVFTSHNYDFDRDLRMQFEQVAAEYDARLYIGTTADSWYYPGRTTLVALFGQDWARGDGKRCARRAMCDNRVRAGPRSRGVACARWNRRFVGVELKPEYAEMANERIAREGFAHREHVESDGSVTEQLDLF